MKLWEVTLYYTMPVTLSSGRPAKRRSGERKMVFVAIGSYASEGFDRAQAALSVRFHGRAELTRMPGHADIVELIDGVRAIPEK